MKKIIAALVVLAIAAPAMATTIDAVQISGSEVQISYNATGDSALVRAFGMDATLDSDANFTGTSDTSADYPIFPGSIVIDALGNVTSPGSPIGNPADHPDTQPGLDSSGVTIEMGSLYESGDPAPAITGDLLVLSFDSDCNIAMADNVARGGIVLEDGTPGSTYNVPPLLTYSTLNRAQYATWIAWGKPANWLGSCWTCGDVDENGAITFNDVQVTLNGYLAPQSTTGREDTDMNGAMTFNDVQVVLAQYLISSDCTVLGCPPY